MGKLPWKKLSGVSLLALAVSQASAYELYNDGDTELNANFLAFYGVFHSQENYNADLGEGSSTWTEGYAKYGLTFSQSTGSNSKAFGGFAYLSSGDWYDGDPSGSTDGSERNNKVEDAYLGWKSGDIFNFLGQDGLEISAGRQVITIGDGFLINSDPESYRSGAYYLTAANSFDKTAVLRLGGKEGLRGDLMRLESDNPFQAKTKLNAATLEHVSDVGTIGMTFIDVLSINEADAFPPLDDREDMRVMSLRAQGSAGVENLLLSGEYAKQDKKRSADNENAWYLEAGWTFADAPWTPNLMYRYTRYSESWDPLFTGWSRGWGTWIQGEVAGSYAGPFYSNTQIHQIALKATPVESVSIGALLYDFSSLDTENSPNVDGRELDFFLDWSVTDNVMISPLVGFYKPEKSDGNGGTQVGNSDLNVYSQIVVGLMF